MRRMRAVVVDPGATGRLSIQEVDQPAAGASGAIIRVKAVSLNLGEVRRAQSAEAGQRIGWDIAGVVEEAAGDGSGPSKGARVVGFLPTAGWSELADVHTNALARLPDNVTFAQAATLPVAGMTALYALERGSGLLGRNVLITGASGGVGHFACQLAKLMGARVVGQIHRPTHEALVRESGADVVVVSEDGSAAAEHGPFSVILESVGGTVLANALTMLAPDGVCVSYGSSSDGQSNIGISPFMRTGRTRWYGFLLFNELGNSPASDGLARLALLVSDGRLKPHITLEEHWTKVGEVARDLWERKISGKAVLHMEP